MIWIHTPPAVCRLDPTVRNRWRHWQPGLWCTAMAGVMRSKKPLPGGLWLDGSESGG